MKARLNSGTGNTLISPVDQAPDGAKVKEVNASTVQVEITLSDPSSLNTEPPPTHQITYQFQITVNTADGDLLTSSWTSSDIYKSLWQRPMFAEYPLVLGRWVSQGTYNWITNNGGLLNPLNDASAEHGVAFGGHSSHRTGHSLDMYHCYPAFVTGVTGSAAWTSISNAVNDAATDSNTSEASFQKVVAWISQTRSRFDSLASEPEVKVLYYVNDKNGQTLLKSSQATVNGVVLDTELGAWTTAGSKLYTPWPAHNNHIHVELNDSSSMRNKATECLPIDRGQTREKGLFKRAVAHNLRGFYRSLVWIALTMIMWAPPAAQTGSAQDIAFTLSQSAQQTVPGGNRGFSRVCAQQHKL